MADLTFGESLGQLNSSSYNPWVKSIFSYLKVVAVSRICRSWPGVTRLLNALVPADVKAKRKMHLDFSVEKVNKRMAHKTDRPDIWAFVTKYSEIEGKRLGPTELHSNGALFMLAGTETTATELSGLTYLLLKNPAHLARLTAEVRSAFSSFDDMTMTKLSQLEFLNACLEEGLRMYPPLPVGLPRTTPEGGARICGHWVAGGVSKAVSVQFSKVWVRNMLSHTFLRQPFKVRYTHRLIRLATGRSRRRSRPSGFCPRARRCMLLIGRIRSIRSRSVRGIVWGRSKCLVAV